MAATEKALGNLHSKLAEVLIEALDGTELEGYEDPDTGEIVASSKIPPSASIMTVAAKFLKDNEITADVEQNDQLQSLRDKLTAKNDRLKDKSSVLTPDEMVGITEHNAFVGNA